MMNGIQGYSTGAEMALEVFQTRKGPAAILARQGLPMGGSRFLLHFPRGRPIVFHGGLMMVGELGHVSHDGIADERGKERLWGCRVRGVLRGPVTWDPGIYILFSLFYFPGSSHLRTRPKGLSMDHR